MSDSVARTSEFAPKDREQPPLDVRPAVRKPGVRNEFIGAEVQCERPDDRAECGGAVEFQRADARRFQLKPEARPSVVEAARSSRPSRRDKPRSGKPAGNMHVERGSPANVSSAAINAAVWPDASNAQNALFGEPTIRIRHVVASPSR